MTTTVGSRASLLGLGDYLGVIRCPSAVLDTARARPRTKSQVAPPAGFEPATRGLEGLQH